MEARERGWGFTEGVGASVWKVEGLSRGVGRRVGTQQCNLSERDRDSVKGPPGLRKWVLS